MSTYSNTDVTVTGVETIVVTSPGPIGPAGPQGPQGDPGTVSASSGLSVTGSADISGSLIISGSVYITGSNTLINEGPTVLSGSVDISGSLVLDGPIINTGADSSLTGSFTGSFLGDGSGLTNIPATAIQDAGFSRIATGSVTASVDVGATSFLFNVGGSDKLVITDEGKVGIGTTSPTEVLDINGNLVADSGSFRAGLEVTGSVYFADLPTQGYSNIVVVDPLTGRLATTSSQIDAVTTIIKNNQESNIIFATGEEHDISGSSNMRIVDNGNTLSVTGSITAHTITGSFTGSGAGLVDLKIGSPDDTSYGDGFFVDFTSETKVSNAIDEISEAFLALAPDPAATLTGNNLTINSPGSFTGYLSQGLNAANWPVGLVHTQVSGLTTGSSVEILASGSELFKAGRKVSLDAGALTGGVTASIAIGTGSFNVVDTVPLANGAPSFGLAGIIKLLGTRVYNSFWVQASASINYTMNSTGSYKYTVSADNGAGASNISQLYYIGSEINFPDQETTVPVTTLISPTYNYLSGVQYLRSATFTMTYTGSNLYNPIYTPNQITFSSSYFTPFTDGNNSPNQDDILISSPTRTLLPNLNSGQTSPSATLIARKPGKADFTSDFLLSDSRVNSYTASLATDQTNLQVEYFFDESKRIQNLVTRSWNSVDVLENGNLQVENGRLICAQYGSYPLLTQGGTGGGYAEYLRSMLTGTDYRINGTFRLSYNTGSFASVPLISKWGSSGDLQAVLVLSDDILSPTSASTIYDFGRMVGEQTVTPEGLAKGIKQTITTGSDGVFETAWALPSGVTTGTSTVSPATLWLRYSGTSNTDYITQINLTFS